jgi:hypothetical protein
LGHATILPICIAGKNVGDNPLSHPGLLFARRKALT